MVKKSKDFPNDKVVPPFGLTDHQNNLIESLKRHEMTVAIGPAGTGKTFVTAAYAAWFLKQKGEVDKIILTRPVIPTGRSIGFFPGSLEEKMEPWTAPFTSVLKKFLGSEAYECQVKKGNIEIVPFEVIRGRSFDRAFVILDEAQNTSVPEIKAFLTRHGTGSRSAVLGDPTQSDLPKGSDSGLDYMIDLIENSPRLKEAVPIIRFTSEDIVRSDLCKLWVSAMEKKQNTKGHGKPVKETSQDLPPFIVSSHVRKSDT